MWLRIQILAIMAIIAMMGIPMNVHAEPDYVAQLARLRELAQKQSISSQELAEARALLERIRSDAPKGARDVSDSLLSIVEIGKDNVIGPLAVPAACEKADAQGADRFVKFIQGLVAEIQRRPPSNKERSTIGAAAVVSAFWGEGARSIAGTTTQPRQLLDTVIEATTAPASMLPPDVRQKALLLVADSAIAPTVRKEYALRFISLRRNEPAPNGFAQLFSAVDFPKLRELIHPPNDAPETFSYGAADLLAHHGDKAALPDLKAFLDRHAVGKPTPEGMIRWNIWQIEQQHPPAKLLEYIRGTDQRAGEEGRIWAMKRALELRIDKQFIRDAVLAHAEAVKANGPTYSLSSLKKAAIDCRVLNTNDLPEVVIAQSPATP